MAITRTAEKITLDLHAGTRWSMPRRYSVHIDENGERWVDVAGGEFYDSETFTRRVCRRNDSTWEAWKVDPSQLDTEPMVGTFATFEEAAAATK